MFQKVFTFVLLFCFATHFAQVPKKLSSNEIYTQIQKLNFFGKVLYVAAHPDDENTKLITYFSNNYNAETAYLSLTRGDGGQNLIGPELREKLGAIRTQELLAARNIDGGTQFFSRANDFGYSKEPNETFAIWNKSQVLEDVIQTIETFQPDIIINRFNHRTPGSTHGHHTASAILSLEAFDLVKTKPKRVFFNTSWWFYGSEEAFEKADKSNLVSFNANVFYPLLGKSNNEIAALSRSQHKCQGFGTTGSRGSETEYLELLKGDLPKSDNLFIGIDTSWNRIKGGNEIGKILIELENNFNFKNPETHIPDLVKAYTMVTKLDDSHWKKSKLAQLSKIIEACAGLYLEAKANVSSATKNSPVSIDFEMVNRSNSTIKINGYSILNQHFEAKPKTLSNNERIAFTEKNFVIPNDVSYSNLFWLNEPATVGMYTVSDKNIRILPEEKLQFPISFELEINNTPITFVKNLIYKTNKPESGETYIPFIILPEVTSEILSKVTIFNSNQTKEIAVKVTAHKANFKGIVKLETIENWNIEPNSYSFEAKEINESKVFTFKVTSPKTSSNTNIIASVISNNNIFNKELIHIDYEHIPKQTILQNAEAKLVNLDINTSGKNIGYVLGAGDEVGQYLQNLNYKVTFIESKDITAENLVKFDAILIGIRAFNVLEELKFKNKVLFKYVENGGNLIVQYNTAHNLVTKEIAPYDLSLSRDRVTNENATVTFLNKNHKVLNFPNKITETDFQNWVQEQGLYYPNKWATNFEPIISAADEGEVQKEGALLIAKYGKGNYIYTGLSFFRELPEGVSGAYKLLANLIALEKN